MSSCVALEPGEGTVTPQRPTLSVDTSTTVEGTLELEAGASVEPDEGLGVPVTLKYGAGRATEVFLDGPLLIHDEDLDETGIGDLALGIRHRVRDESEKAPSVAVLAKMKYPTASESRGLGSGDVDATVGAVAAKTFGGIPVVAFYTFDVLGNPAGGTDIGHSMAVASGMPVHGALSAFGEIAGIFVPDQNTDNVFTTLGLAYAVSHALVLDGGVVVGLSDDAADFQIVFGLTRNFGRRRP